MPNHEVRANDGSISSVIETAIDGVVAYTLRHTAEEIKTEVSAADGMISVLLRLLDQARSIRI